MLVATSVVVVTTRDGVGEVAGRRVGEAAGVGRPAEAGVEVQLGPVLLLVVDLAVGLEHHGAPLVAVEVGQGQVGAGAEETAGGEGGASQGKGGDGGNGRGPHFDGLFLMREYVDFVVFDVDGVYWSDGVESWDCIVLEAAEGGFVLHLLPVTGCISITFTYNQNE